MKKLIRFLLVLALGAALGYIFNDVIDGKLKEKYGDEKVETVRENAKEKIGEGVEKGGEIVKGAVEGAKDSIQNQKEE